MSARTVRAEFRVCFERAYHVGAGHGRGTSLDAALFTETVDGVEVPAVRYAHGVLRQAVFDLLQTPPLAAWRRCPASGKPRPEGTGGAPYCTREETPCPLCRIFGSAAWPSPWELSSMRPAEDFRPGTGPLSQVVSRASVDPRTRRARDATLFSEELGAPLPFAFTAASDAPDRDEALDELALLVAAARTVSALGADRRRGRGECALRLHAKPDGDPDLAEAALLKRFERAWLRADPSTATPPARHTARFADAHPAVAEAERRAPAVWTRRADAPARVAVRLVLRLEEPLAAGARPLAGNVLVSERFVAGTLLLGALAARALRSGRAAEADFLHAFRGGGALFPDLLPALVEGETYRPTLPAPRDLFTCGIHPGPAGHEGHGFWSALLAGEEAAPAEYDPVHAVRCPACREEIRALPAEDQKAEAERRHVKARRVEPFVVAGAGAAYQLEPRMRQETKVQVDPATGRVHETSLYHREVIAAGTLLAGTLYADAHVLENLAAWGALPGGEGAAELHLGKRSGRGYGRATLAWTRVGEDEREGARKAAHDRVTACLDAGRPVPLVLASRLLARDALGRAHRSLTAGALGLPGGGRASVEWGITGGFWRHLGLPRRQEPALLAGSVLHWEPPQGEGAACADRLAALEDGGVVGERTAEGFGRVAVAPFPYAWVGGAEPADEALPLPAALRRDAPAAAWKGLRDDPAAGHHRAWENDLAAAEADFSRDEWRAVARLLYVRAGDDYETLKGWLFHGGGEPAKELKRVRVPSAGAPQAEGEGRGAKHFLQDGLGEPGWKALAPLLADATKSASASERALRTRALADALAAMVTPGKGTDG